MTCIINISRILNIMLVLIMNSFSSSGSFLENFLHYTTIHIRKESKNNINLTALDPLNFEKTVLINDSNLRLDVSFNGFLKGYSNYDFEKIDITPDLNVSFIGTLIDAQVFGNYKMNGSYFTVLPILGKGQYLFKLKNVRLALDTKIQPMSGHIQILNFDMDYSYDDLQISLWGLTGDQAVGNILEEFTKDFLSTVLIRKKKTFTKLLKNYVLEEGNAKLKNMTLSNMIEIAKDVFVY